MLYRTLRAIARLALRWFYREIEVVGVERIPADAPLLVAVNHPNALVDALVVGTTLERRLTLTAKATLFEHALLRPILNAVGVVPLRRASDEAVAGTAGTPARNTGAFRAILATLERRSAVLIFPEGKSHSEPQLAPLKTGVSRLALQARERGARGLVIVPVGLTFERKWEPRSRVAVQVGAPIEMDRWTPPPGADAVEALTDEVDRRLREVTLNFPTADQAEAVLGVSHALAGMLGGAARPLRRAEVPLVHALDVARRVSAAQTALGTLGTHGDPVVRQRADDLLARLERLRAELAALGLVATEVWISTGTWRGLGFALREGAVVLLGGPVAWWGRLNHWPALRLAGYFARRTSRNPDEPAMRTIVAGLLLVVASYALQTAVVARLAGGWWAAAYLLSLPIAATWDFRFRDRLQRARARVRAYLTFRRTPGLQDRLRREIGDIVADAAALEQTLGQVARRS